MRILRKRLAIQDRGFMRSAESGWRDRPLWVERGQSMTEFALVLPILLLIFMGIFDFGRMIFLYSQLSNGAREGARYGSVSGLDASDPQYLECAEIRQAITNTFGVPATITTQIFYDHGIAADPVLNAGGQVGNCNGSASNLTPDDVEIGDRIRVTATATFQFITPFVSAIRPNMTVSFTSARTLLKEGIFVPDVGP